MKLLLSSRDCVRFGIVKGCPCVLEDIVFGKQEVLPYERVAGQLHELEFMPVSMILRAEGALWTLPPSELPSGILAPVDKRGLF